MSERPRGRELQPGETLRPDEDCWDDETDEAEAGSSLDIALALAAAGTPVFPCNALKRPAIAKAAGGRGFQDATTNPDRIRELWYLAGAAAQLVGSPTGGASDFDVLDFDPRHGSDSWRAANIHRLPETRVHGTPGLPKIPTDTMMPGEHWLFRHVDGVRNIQDGQSIAPGIDVRGSGGYVIMPPSIGYRVIHETDIAPWPDWLLPLVLKVAKPAFVPAPSSYATPAKVTDNRLRGFVDREVRRVRDAPVGARHGARLSAARSIGGIAAEAGLSDTEVEEMLIAARPPEVEEEKERRTIRDGLAYGRAAPIDLNTLPGSAQFRGHRQHGGNGAANGAAAPEPDAKPDDTEPDPLPLPDGDQDTGPDGQTAGAEDTEAGDAQVAAPRAPYGPPTEAEFIAELAALDEIAFARIAKAKAALLGVDVFALTKRVQRARNEAKAKAQAAAKAAATAAKAAEAARKKAEAKEKAKQLPPLTEAEVAAEIEHLRQLSDAAFYAERPDAALRLRCSATELTELVRRAKADYARKNATIPPFVTEQDVMRAFVTQFSDDLRFNHSSGSWLVWAEHFWQPDQRKLAFYWALDLCKQMAPSASDDGRAVVEKVRFSAAVETGARVMPQVASTQEDWDNDPWLLGTPGGVVDLKTGRLRHGKRGDMITMTTAVTPAATEDCPLWLKFLAEATGGDTGMVGFLKRHFGYCLTGLTMEEMILYLFGPGGAGKGTVVKTVTGILDDYVIVAPIELFTEQSFRPSEYYRAQMAGKRLLVAAETERGSYWSESFVKEISGGDEMSGRHPAGRPFKFDPTHKPLIHANHMPKLRGPSTAMERRLRVAPFTHKPAVPDTKLKDKLRAESAGILRWMINGCLEWQRDGLKPPTTVIGASKAYFDAQDALGRWIEDCCILDPYKRLPPTVLRTSYNNWAKANGEDEMDGAAFAEAIDQFAGARLIRGKSGSQRWIKGLDLQPKSTGRPWWLDDRGDAGEPAP